MRVYVHLAYGFDAESWRRRWESGSLIGINEQSPYGYHRAAAYGAAVMFSRDAPESVRSRLLRLGLRALLGFDALHAWRNRANMRDCDIVWTHTESNHLAVAAVMILGAWARRPYRAKLLAQSVWLFDSWARISPLRRRFYRGLMSQADVLTVHSPDNRAIAREVMPEHRVELVPFGIRADDLVPPRINQDTTRINILSVGNDRHRDWKTLVDAVNGLDSVAVKIVSRTIDRKLLSSNDAVSVAAVEDNSELMSLYAWADVIVVPLKPNSHASGVTVCQEGTVRGVPVIASDTGGLREYFDDSCFRYVPPEDAQALRAAIVELQAEPPRRRDLVDAARKRMGPGGVNSDSFIRSHCEISRSLLDLDSTG